MRGGLLLAGISSASLLITAGCSSNPAKSDEIVIGTIGSYSGASSSSLGPGKGVIEAWVKDLNAGGGINGRRVKLIVKDDGGNATKGLAAAKELISQDKVVAVVGETSEVDSVWADYVSASGVPVIGGAPHHLPFATNADFFPSGASALARTYGKVAESKTFGNKVGYLYCAESPGCKTTIKLIEMFGKDLGVEVAVEQSISGSAPNYTAQCQAIKSSGVQSYQTSHASAVALRIQDACAAQGVTATQVSGGGIVDSSWLSHRSAQGTINIDLDFPFFDTSIPATKAYHVFLQKHNLGDAGGGSGTYPYVGAKLFEAAAKAVGSAPVTPKSLKAALYAMHGETLGGLSAPLTFKQGQPTLVNCWFVSKIDKFQWTTPQGLKTTCAPDALMIAAAKTLLH